MDVAATPSPRAQALAAADPRYRVNHYSSRSNGYARPIDMLGAPPAKVLVFITEAARALLSSEAAGVSLQAPPPVPSGLGVDVRG